MFPRLIQAYLSRSLVTMERVTIESMKFDNRVLRSLPVDKDKDNYCRTVQGACYSRVNPTPVTNPILVSVSLPALALLGLDSREVDRPEFIQYFSGSKVLPGSEPAAHCYCGHQFGAFSGQLGDGCAHYLGEVIGQDGLRYELQLKGSGKTPYSRAADGRKVLRSSIREYLCSEAMHHLGIPTTRAGSCVTSDSYVARDPFYNGITLRERVTVISRIAPTFIRFGSFEICKTRDALTGRAGPSVGNTDILDQLVDYTIKHFYPQSYSAYPDSIGERVASFYHDLCSQTAKLVAKWQCVGFCHGVLNTDNMSIVGITIDYGPFGFLERYLPEHICNASDDGGRYSYENQPSVCKWNLKKLGEALSSNLSEEHLSKGLEIYDTEYQNSYLSQMKLKLGLIRKNLPDDSDLIEAYLQTLFETGCDYTNANRNLNQISLCQLNQPEHLQEVCEVMLNQCLTPSELIKSFKPKMSLHQIMILSTQSPHLLQQLGLSHEILENELSRYMNVEKMKEVSEEDRRKSNKVIWMSWLEQYKARMLHEIEGLSDIEIEKANKERLNVLNNNNPKFILRNHIAQRAIESAENGDYSEVNKVMKLLQTPYKEDIEDIQVSSQPDELNLYCSKPSVDYMGLLVT